MMSKEVLRDETQWNHVDGKVEKYIHNLKTQVIFLATLVVWL